MRLAFFKLLLLMFLGAGCLQPKQPAKVDRSLTSPTTFAKFLELARSGNATSQNLIGFMLYFGEVAPLDRAAAHYWFHRAAEQGNVSAQLNLAVMHYLGVGVPRDRDEAQRYFRLVKAQRSEKKGLTLEVDVPDSLVELAERARMRPQSHEESGEATYMTFCAGCHGLNGIAAYAGAPSFALGERMEKQDADLLYTIIHGHGVMPTWGSKLSMDALTSALRFIRTLPRQYRNGIAQSLRTAPAFYFLFGPMSAEPVAYEPDYLRY